MKRGAAAATQPKASATAVCDRGKPVVCPSIALPGDGAPSDRAAPDPLIARALAGDRPAWAALIAQHDRVVMVSLLARGVAMELARELTQETWLRLIEQQRCGRLHDLRLPGLAITLARFLFLTGLRAVRPVEQPPQRPLALAPDPGPSIEDRLLGREQLSRAEQALAACSPSARQTFALIYDEPSLPHAEVAQRLGLSLQRVRQTLCEVRKRIRSALEGDA